MLNKAQIIGRLGRDPEIRYMPSGEAVCNFSLATTEKWKDKTSGEMKEHTEWHRVSAWGRLAEIMGEYARKGSLLFIEGKMTSREYKKADGTPEKSFEVRATDLKLLSSRGESGNQAQSPAPAPAPRATQAPSRQPVTAAAGTGFDDMDDDVPFVTNSMTFDMTTSKQRRMNSYGY